MTAAPPPASRWGETPGGPRRRREHRNGSGWPDHVEVACSRCGAVAGHLDTLADAIDAPPAFDPFAPALIWHDGRALPTVILFPCSCQARGLVLALTPARAADALAEAFSAYRKDPRNYAPGRRRYRPAAERLRPPRVTVDPVPLASVI